jgi:hypothetical protein
VGFGAFWWFGGEKRKELTTKTLKGTPIKRTPN